MATALQKQIKTFQEEAEEYSEAREDALNAKTDFSVAAIGALMEKLTDGIDDLAKSRIDSDKELCSTLKDTITNLATAFSKLKSPTVNVEAPNISVDLSPIKLIADNISSQNKSLLGLVDKINNGNKSDELYKLVVALVDKQNTFLSTALKQVDYTDKLTQLISVLGQSKPLIDEIEIIRNNDGVLKGMKPVYKKNEVNVQ